MALMTIAKLAEQTGLSEQSIRHIINQGYINPYKLPTAKAGQTTKNARVLIDKDEFEAWAKSGIVESGQEADQYRSTFGTTMSAAERLSRLSQQRPI